VTGVEDRQRVEACQQLLDRRRDEDRRRSALGWMKITLAGVMMLALCVVLLAMVTVVVLSLLTGRLHDAWAFGLLVPAGPEQGGLLTRIALTVLRVLA
jgi:hypothetical protein